MIAGLAKYIGNKLLAALLVVCSGLIIIWYWRLGPEGREAIWIMVRGALIWLGFVAVLPWALFFIPARVVRAESNLLSALVLLAYLVMDILFALYLSDWQMGNVWQSGVLLLGFLCAAVYNFLVCEFLADRFEDSM
jgi:hypothetical protein